MNAKTMNGMEYDKEAIIEYIESQATRDDCEAWHQSRMTKHMQDILDTAHATTEYDFIPSVWGMPNPEQGEEPLSVTLA